MTQNNGNRRPEFMTQNTEQFVAFQSTLDDEIVRLKRVRVRTSRPRPKRTQTDYASTVV